MAAPRQLQLRVVDSCEAFNALKFDWGKILSSLNDYPPFLTWEWMYTWWLVYKTSSTRLLVLVVLDNSNAIAIAPFYINENSFPIKSKSVYFLGTGEQESKEVFSEYLDIICMPGYTHEASSVIMSYFFANKNLWDCMKFERVLEDSELLHFYIKFAEENRHVVVKKKCGLRYFVQLPATWEKYLQDLKPSMRRSIKQANKNFQERPGYKVDVIDTGDAVEPVMQKLAELHTKSWKSKGKIGAFASEEFREFHLKVAKLLLSKNMLMMLKISISNDVVAILYNFKVLGTSYYYQSGLNMEKYSSLKPGVQLHSEAMKDAINVKMKKYDFMMSGIESYKGRYGCRTSAMFHINIWNIGLRAMILQKLALIPYLKRLI